MSQSGRNKPDKSLTKIQNPPVAQQQSGAGGSGLAPGSVSRETRIETYQESFSGPLPHPKTLEHYERVCAGAADRIIAMAERQAAHRQALETTVVTGNVRAMHRSQIGATFLGALGMVLGATLVYFDKDIGGYATMLGSIGSLLWIYLRGKKQQEEEVGQKRAQEILNETSADR